MTVVSIRALGSPAGQASQPGLVLGIESSCDETGVALVEAASGQIVAQALHSQVTRHAPYGGVVPELASRDHLRHGLPLVAEVLKDAGATSSDIGLVAYTQGPGLGGALLAGAQLATSLAAAWSLPVLPVHHMEAHLLSPLLADPAPQFPFLALLVSGGHTQLMHVAGIGRYALLGETIDDAAGEAFDKCAKLLGIAYPGGSQLALLAELGDAKSFRLPRPLAQSDGLDFSFAGLKTAVAHLVRELAGEPLPQRGATSSPQPILPIDHPRRADLAASVQAAIVDSLVSKSLAALDRSGLTALVVAGGVGANGNLRQKLAEACASRGVRVFHPPPSLCTDNGVMVAWAASLRAAEASRDYSVRVRPRWPLATLSPPRSPA